MNLHSIQSVFLICGENVSPVSQKWLKLTIKLSFYLPVVKLVQASVVNVFSIERNPTCHHKRVPNNYALF